MVNELFKLPLEELVKLHDEITQELNHINTSHVMHDKEHSQIYMDLQVKLEIINSALSIKKNISKVQRVADKKIVLKDLKDKNTQNPHTKAILCDNMDCPNDAVITKGCIIKRYLIYVNLCDKHNETFAKWVEELKNDVKEGDKKRRGGIK